MEYRWQHSPIPHELDALASLVVLCIRFYISRPLKLARSAMQPRPTAKTNKALSRMSSLRVTMALVAKPLWDQRYVLYHYFTFTPLGRWAPILCFERDCRTNTPPFWCVLLSHILNQTTTVHDKRCVETESLCCVC